MTKTSEGKNQIWYVNKSQMVRALGIDKRTLEKWLTQNWFPTKTLRGWNKKRVLSAVDKHNRERKESQAKAVDKDRKLILECERLEVVISKERQLLEQAEIETQKIKGELVLRHEIEQEDRNFVRFMLEAVKGFIADQTAKHPEHVDLVEILGHEVLRVLREKVSAM